MQGWGDVGPRAALIYLRGKSRVTLLPASHREVINYLSVSHQSAPEATANHKLTLNLTCKHTCTNMYTTHRQTHIHRAGFAISPTLYAQTFLTCRQTFPNTHTHTPIEMTFWNHCSREKKWGSLSAQLSLKIHFDAFSSFHVRFHPGKTATSKKKRRLRFVLFLHYATQDRTKIKIQMLYHFMRQWCENTHTHTGTLMNFRFSSAGTPAETSNHIQLDPFSINNAQAFIFLLWPLKSLSQSCWSWS